MATVIDGGHFGDVLDKDFNNFRPMVNSANQHILIIDDWPGDHFPDSIGKMWKEKLETGKAEEVFHCTNAKKLLIDGKSSNLKRGFTIGRFL